MPSFDLSRWLVPNIQKLRASLYIGDLGRPRSQTNMYNSSRRLFMSSAGASDDEQPNNFTRR